MAAPDAPLVVAALSGGVDSAVAAALAVEAGARVVGMTLRLYDAAGTAASSGGRCCGPRDVEDARAVCAHLGIPFYVVDLEAAFRRDVVDDFVEAYLAGETPNPCVRCNQTVKFTPLLARARQLGGGRLVTGHYARVVDGDDGPRLARGLDRGKDQSYFLFAMPPEALPAVTLPLGALTKDEVRAHARRLGLPNAAKAESQEICFVPDGDHAGFVAASALRRGRSAPAPGPIVDRAGNVVGAHDGVHHFTIGQHRGLGNLRSEGGATRRQVVLELDAAGGRVVVGERVDGERREVGVRGLRWLGPSPSASLRAGVQLRHRGAAHPATVRWQDQAAVVELDEPTLVAPGQAAVIFDGEIVLGGGWVTSPPASA
ncbi:MAG: tRNA 2-thiouridine(34) synthase MnmA [Kofleriaceae bacterium]